MRSNAYACLAAERSGAPMNSINLLGPALRSIAGGREVHGLTAHKSDEENPGLSVVPKTLQNQRGL